MNDSNANSDRREEDDPADPLNGITGLSPESFPVVGGVCRIEHQQTHRQFVQAVEPSAVMLDIRHAWRFANNGRSGPEWFPEDTTTITTTTIPDEELDKLSLDREEKYIRAFEPDFHVPADRPVYRDTPRPERVDAIDAMAEGTLRLADRLTDSLQTALTPLVKGYTRPERETCYRLHDALNAPFAVFYAAQYLSNSPNLRPVLEDINPIAAERPDIPLLAIGVLSDTYFNRLPETVVAGAGLNAWRSVVAPTTHTSDEMQSNHTEVVAPIEATARNRLQKWPPDSPAEK